MKHFFKLYPVVVVLLFTFLNIWGFSHVLQIKTHSSLEQFLPKNHPLLETDRQLRKRFEMEYGSPLVVIFKSNNESWVSPDYLKELSMISEKIKENVEVSYILSLANIQAPASDENSFTVAPISELNKTPEQIQSIMSNPLIAPHFVSKDGKYAAMIIRTNSLSYQQQAEFIKKIEKTITNNPKMYTAQVAGPTAISAQMTSILSEEITLFGTLSVLISVIALFIIFKSISTALTSIIIVVSANFIALGLMSFFGLPLTVLSSTVPILVTLSVITVLSQTLARLSEFQREAPVGAPRHVLIFTVLKELTTTHYLSALATAIGFATLMGSEIPIIHSYGMSVSFCVLVSCGTTLMLFSALYMWLPIPQKRNWPWKSDFFARKIIQYNKPLAIGILSLCVAFGAMGAFLNWSVLLFDDLPKTHPAREATALAEKHLGGVMPLEISMGSETLQNPWEDPARIQLLNQITQEWRNTEGVGSVISMADFIKVASPTRQIASTQQKISETLFVYSMANENPLNHFVTASGKYTRIAIRLIDQPSLKVKEISDKMKLQLEKNFPDMKVETAGLASTSHPIHEDLSRELIYGFYYALLWIVFILCFFFGPLAIFAAIPNLVPPMILLGALAITQTPIKPGIAIIFSISIGIAFDNTVYILSKIKSFRKKKKEWSVFELMCEELGPCFVTSCAVMSGFAVFTLSGFAMNKIFGAFMVLAVASGLLGDLVLFPALLSLFPRLLIPTNLSGNILATARLSKMLPSLQKFTASLFTFLFVFLFSPWGQSAPSMDDIIKRMQAANKVPSELMELNMKIEEADGTVKNRSMVIKRKSGKEQKAMVKLLEPTNLKGFGLLTLISANKEQSQYLYVPSEKRSRRLVGSNKKGRFLDSELNLEDMSIETYENFTNKVTENTNDKGKKITVVESTVKNKDESSYSKIKTWLESDNLRILKAEYYDMDGKLLKTISFNNYKQFGKNVWRPQIMSVKNVQKNRGTTLEIKKVSLKKLDDSEFAMSALEEG